MKRKPFLRLLLAGALLAAAAAPASGYGMPESVVTRTHLLKSIQRGTGTFAVGIESEFRSDSTYSGDSVFGYLGYAFLDWLELGVGAHVQQLSLYPSAEAKIDLLDLFADSGRLSILLMGGAGGLPDDLWFAHGGLGLLRRHTDRLDLYAAAGTDTVSRALSIQAGALLWPHASLGVSVNPKLVFGPQGNELMVSLAALAALRPRDRAFPRSRSGD